MSIFLPSFFRKLRKYVKKYGRPCNAEPEVYLWDGLYISKDSISNGEFCLEVPELAEVLKATAKPDCVQHVDMERVPLRPPYLEYVAERDYALLTCVGPDGVYLVENSGGAVNCICKTDIEMEVFQKSVEILEKWRQLLSL